MSGPPPITSAVITAKLQSCKAWTNKSFDSFVSSPETGSKAAAFREFRQAWDATLPVVLGTPSTTTTDNVNKTNDWIERLYKLHSADPARHYHTAVHLQEMLEYLHVVVDDLHLVSLTRSQQAAVVLSIYFHDAIYNPQSGTNEEDSEQLWQEFVKDMRLVNNNKAIIEQVSQFILATKTHQTSLHDANSNPALVLFLDLDLAVLAKEPSAYLSYAALIRREYHFVPSDRYCAKRAQILQDFLPMHDCLYGTPGLQEVWEEQARSNLRHEIIMLQNGVIPS